MRVASYPVSVSPRAVNTQHAHVVRSSRYAHDALAPNVDPLGYMEDQHVTKIEVLVASDDQLPRWNTRCSCGWQSAARGTAEEARIAGHVHRANEKVKKL